MPKLSEVLGCIVKDMTQAQVTGDLVSFEYVSYYKQDELLRYIPAPRIRIKEVLLTLKFAVSGSSESPDVSGSGKAEAANLWRNHVKGELIPGLLRRISAGSTVAQGLADRINTAVRLKPPPAYDEHTLVTSNARVNARITEEYVAAIVKSLPAEVRAGMVPLREIRKATRARATADLQKLGPRFRRLAVAKTAKEFDLDIMITKEELENTPDSEIHEITLTVGLDDNPLGS